MNRAIDITGRKFGRLRVLKRAGTYKSGDALWDCACDCGASKTAQGSALRKGLIKSCGCLQKETRSSNNRTHGMSNTALYRLWAGMVQRCTNPNATNYANYGGRGVTVCKRWLAFLNFKADMGDRPSGTSIERRNNSRGYSPSNCYWATRKEQNSNKRNNRLLTVGKETMPLTHWATRLGIRHATLRERLDRGWSIERACTTPSKGKAVRIYSEVSV